jgi:septum formation protein
MTMGHADGELVLASASPRRRELMREAGYRFEVRAADVPEELPEESDDPAAEAMRLAEAKAVAVAARVASPGRWVLGADTIVVLGRRLIGKPRDAADAEAILRSLSGSEHRVITGVALVESGSMRRLVRHASTAIRMRRIDDAEIRRYVAGGGSHGKAGAYAVQEGGDRYIERMDGSFTNVVGLPMELLAEMLREVGWKGVAER